MKVNFYEEFPAKESLQKLKSLKFKSVLFLATKSLSEFKNLEKKVSKINKNIECAYWPIIKNSYWISPFSNTSNLLELFSELSQCKKQILIDLEFPLKKSMIIKNIPSYFKNKKLIKDFLDKNKKRVITAQFPPSILDPLIKIGGLNYNLKIKKSLMWYSSMNSNMMNKNITKNLIKLEDKSNYSISLGTIAKGIFENEPLLSSSDLEKDLLFVKKQGFKEVIIFRLEGLNKDYLKIINKFAN